MKNYDYWKSFIKTGRIDDYLHYIACTKEEGTEEPVLLSGMPGKDGPGYGNSMYGEDIYKNIYM